MRGIAIVAAGAALVTAGAAAAQTPGAPYPMPGRGPVFHPPMPPAPHGPMGMPGRGPVVHQPMPRAPTAMPGRWGSRVGGRWWGGVNAPGGWTAYRQPYRGYRLSTYWVAPRFYVSDWSRYGLTAPGGGYRWVRYYDDAVLVDGHGGVADWRGGLDWDGAYAGGDRLNVPPPPGYREPPMAPDGPPPPPRDWRDDDRASMAGDAPPPMRRREQRRVIIMRDGGPGHPPGPPHGPMGGPPGGPGMWVSPDGRTTITTTTSGGYGSAPVIVAPGGYAGGYGGGYAYGGSVTTVTIQSAPVVTTTTTETIEDVVTYRSVARPARHRVWHARPRTKIHPRCACGS